MKFVVAFVDLILYGNFFVAFAAMSMVWQVQIISDGKMHVSDPFGWLVFCGTLIVYALHRVIGFTFLMQTIQTRRVKVIRKFRNHIIAYAVLAFLPLIWLAGQMQFQTIALLGVAGLFSLAYVIPFFRRRRLRDLPFVKVFVVGIFWSMVTTLIPAMTYPVSHASLGWLALEKCLFIIALTLPFDVRDIEIDANHKVRTFATRFGHKAALHGATFCTFLSMVIVLIQALRGFYLTEIAMALLISYIYLLVLIRIARRKRHDYFYTGAVDGAMLLQWVLVLSM